MYCNSERRPPLFSVSRLSATSPAPLFPRPSFVDGHGATSNLLKVQSLNRLLASLAVMHFDKAKTAGSARVAIFDYAYGFYVAKLAERLFQFRLRRLKTEISYINVHSILQQKHCPYYFRDDPFDNQASACANHIRIRHTNAKEISNRGRWNNQQD